MTFPLPVALAVLAVTFWPVTATLLLACLVLAFRLRSGGVRIACGVVGAVVVLAALYGALLPGGDVPCRADAVRLVLAGFGILILVRRPEAEVDMRTGLMQALELATAPMKAGGRA